MRTIYKHRIEVPRPGRIQTLSLPELAEIVSVERQGEDIYLWIMQDPTKKRKTERRIFGTGTGWKIPDGLELEILGTVHMDGLVWHYFEAL